jgi:hypothetical protein
MATSSDDLIEYRKDVWRVFRDGRVNGPILLVSLNFQDVKHIGLGYLIYEDERNRYCDGRIEARPFCSMLLNRRSVVFLPWIPEEAS